MNGPALNILQSPPFSSLDELPEIQTALLNANDLGIRTVRDFEIGRGQIVTTEESPHKLLAVLDGAVALELLLEDGRRQICDFRLPGEVFCSGASLAVLGMGVRAAASSRLRQLALVDKTNAVEACTHTTESLVRLATLQLERLAMHTLVIGRLKPTERVASFVLELALRSKAKVGSGKAEFRCEIGRTDAADYLCLNPDTYSRSISKLKKMDLLRIVNRTYYLPNVPELSQLTPLARGIFDRFGTAADTR